MASDAAALPRDPDMLIEIVVELRDENGKLRAMLETLRRSLYGARSERFEGDAAQLALGLGDVSSAPVEPESQTAATARPRTGGHAPGRDAISAVCPASAARGRGHRAHD